MALSFELPAGWSLLTPEQQRGLTLIRDDGVILSFTRPVRAFAPDPDPDPELADPPDDWVAWLESHPRLRVEQLLPAQVDGLRGTIVDAVVTEPYEFAKCPARCVLLFSMGAFSVFQLEDQKSRAYWLDADGNLSIAIVAPEDDFDEVVSEVDVIVRSIRFVADAPTDPETAEALAKLPAEPGPLEPGRYRTSTFDVPLSFDVPAGALLLSPDRRRSLVLELPQGDVREDSVIVAVMLPVRAATPDPQPTFEAAPDDWAAWFESHPRLRAGERKPVEVGGVRGVAIDAAVTDPYEDPGCPAPCVYLFTSGDSTAFAGGGQTIRNYILELDGQTLLIGILAPSERFDELVGQGEAVVRSIRFE